MSAWAQARGVPCWIQDLPDGWVLARTATINGALAGSGEPPERALRDWASHTPDAYLVDDLVRTVRGGEVVEFSDAPPWETADPRPVRGLVAARGDRTPDLGLLAYLHDEPVAAVFRDGWTLIPDDEPLPAAVDALVERAVGLALLRVGDELRLWLVEDGEPVVDWEWSVTGRLAAVDRLPAGELGDQVRDLLFPARLGVEPLVDAGFVATPALAQALAADGPAHEVAPRLVAALGLPDAARSHLLGEVDLTRASDVRVTEPPTTLARAITSGIEASERQRASTQTPRRRLWGAIGWAASLALCALLLAMIVDDLRSGDEISVWTWLRLPMVVVIIPVALLGIRRWWVLRGTGQRSASELPAVAPRGGDPSRRGWFHRRGPSTAIAAALGLGCLAAMIGMWIWAAPLRDNGVRTSAEVIAVGEETMTVSFRDRQGNPATTEIGRWGEPRVGDSIVILYEASDPSRAMAMDDFADPSFYIVFGALAGLCLVLALLTWVRVIDWQRVSNWMGNAPGV